MSSQTIEFEDMVEEIPEGEIPDEVVTLYNNVSQSMLKQIRKRGIRKFSDYNVERWVRLKFGINEDQQVVEKHKIVASQVSRYLLKTQKDYKIPLNEIRNLLELDQELENQRQKEREKYDRLRSEVELLRKRKQKNLKKHRKSISSSKKGKLVTESTEVKNNGKVTPVQETVNGIDYDYIYGKWMDHIKTKSTSKSYWYIHEYIGRFILKFALAKKSSLVSHGIVQDFLDDYGKGKAAKTMNHYNRVAKYFLEFCQALD